MTRFRGVAFFDFDGTVVDSDIVRYYVFLRTCRLENWQRLFWLAGFMVRAPYYWAVDHVSRTLLNTVFYRNYRGYERKQLCHDAELLYSVFIEPRIYPAAIESMKEHQGRGERIVLVSGSLGVLLEPAARRLPVDAVYAAELETDRGRCTGGLVGGPLTAENKAEVVRSEIAGAGAPRNDTFAYADSFDDRAMLEAVAKPRAVNPDRRLRRLAEARGWKVLNWKRSSI